MSLLARRAERLKLARALGVDADSLRYVDKLDERAIKTLREHATNLLFDRNSHMFQRVAASSKLLPASLLSVIAERAIGPWLCALIAGHMPPDRAIDLANRLPVPFLADTCINLDPRRVQALIRGVPRERVLLVARELIKRSDFITMARFIDCLPDATLKAVLDDIKDDGALLQIAYFVDNTAHLNHVIGLIPEARIRRTILVANERRLWPEALALMSYVTPDLRTRLVDLAASESDAMLSGMLEAIHADNLWADALPMVSHMSTASKERLINLPVARQEAVLSAIVEAARGLKLWPDLLPLVQLMDVESQRQVALLANNLPDDFVQEIITTAHAHNLWVVTLSLVEQMGDTRQADLAMMLSDNEPAVLESLIAAMSTDSHWIQLLAIAQRMPAATQIRLIEAGLKLDSTVLLRLIEAADQVDAWDMALRALAATAPETQARVPQVLKLLPAEQRQRLGVHAERLGLGKLLA